MKTKVLVNGAFGRMGQLVTKAIQEDSALELVGQTGREYELTAAIRDSGAVVVVDFTHPDVVYKNTMAIIESGASPVIGTSGLTKDDIVQLQALCDKRQLGGIIVPNFSIGAVLMMRFAREAASHLKNVEIIEMHHAEKVDSPSGTAMRTAEMIAEGRGETLQHVTSAPEKAVPARGFLYDGVPIHSVRLSGVLASQTVIFGELGETLSIRHDSIQRESFMPGVCYACKKVRELRQLAYGLEAIL